MTEETFLLFVKSAWHLLTEHKQTLYSQKEIAGKLRALNHSVAESTLSKVKKIVQGKIVVGTLGGVTRHHLIYGFKDILRKELCMIWDEEKLVFFELEDNSIRPTLVLPAYHEPKNTFHLYKEGRLSLALKTAYIKDASHEIIELGLRLHSFVAYFYTRSQSEYARHLHAALARGVRVKLYVAAEQSRFLADYFNDRARVFPEEWEAYKDISHNIERLEHLCNTLNAQYGPGKVSLYQYYNFPYGYAQVIDPNSNSGKIRYSAYLYGIRRADCPVLEVEKAQDKALFTTLWGTVSQVMANSKKML